MQGRVPKPVDPLIKPIYLKNVGYGQWFRLTSWGSPWHLLIADPRPYFKGVKRTVHVEVCIGSYATGCAGSREKETRWVDEESLVYLCDPPVWNTLPMEDHNKEGGHKIA